MLSFNSCLFQCIIYWYCSVIYTLLCTYNFRHFTHSLGVSASLNLHFQAYGYYILLIRYLGRAHALRRAGVLFAWSSNLGISSCLLSFSPIFLWFFIGRTLYLFYWFICKIILSCVEYVTLQWFLMPSLLIDIACSGHFRFNVYTWGIFLAYIRRRLSSRLRFNVFWEGRDKNSSVTLFL